MAMTVRFLVLTVCVSSVNCAPEASKNYSYCKDINIPLNLSCDNSFLIKDKSLARVTGDHAEVLWPFFYDKDQGTMQIRETINFTHRSLCELQDNMEKEEITNYQHSLNTCSKQNGASAIQGPLAVLLIMTLVYVMFHLKL